MEIIPYLRILKFLRSLDDETKIKDPKYIVRDNTLHNHYGTEESIKNYLIDIGLVGKDGQTSSQGKIFLEKYSGRSGYLELLAKDYPFLFGALLFGMFGGFIGNLIIELVKFLIK